MTTLKSTSFGFTLIELMVSVSIIGILMGAGIVAFTSTQARARDARRRADISALSRAMEQIYANGLPYPVVTSGIATSFASGSVPKDPKSAADYTYSLTTTKYCICATLEKTNGNVTAAPSAGACTYLGTQTGTLFCASNLQ